MKSFKSSLTFPQDNILSLWLESLSVLWLHPYFITARISSPLPSPCFAAYLPPIAGDTPFGFQPAVARSASSRAKKQTIRMVKPPCSHSISISQPHHIHIFHCQAWEWQTHSGLHQVTLIRESCFPPHIKNSVNVRICSSTKISGSQAHSAFCCVISEWHLNRRVTSGKQLYIAIALGFLFTWEINVPCFSLL